MEFYFLRHGAAVARGEWDGDDSLRPLTDSGREQVARMAELLARMTPSIDAVVTSPYLRAAETAEIAAQHLDLGDTVVSDERLSPGFDAGRLAKLVKQSPEANALLLVGHEPDFSTTIRELTGARVVFKKGALAMVETPDDAFKKASLVWLLQPGIVGA
jgi:phosphohistidine phosphatase